MKIKINENDLKKIVSETIKKVIKEYNISDVDEVMEYMWLKPEVTGLKVDIFVDDGGSYERHNHQLLLLIRNGYTKMDNTYITMSVSDKPKILNSEIDYNISYNDIFAVQDFIQLNLVSLFMLATRRISQIEFVNSIKVPNYVITEAKKVLLEMATLRKEDSGLPMDIWLDEGHTYEGHAPRLKFRASNEQRTTWEFSSMLLTNPPTIENFPKDSPIKKKDINKLENFVISNLEILLKLAKGEINYVKEFLPKIKNN